MIRPIADSKRYGFAVGRVRVLETRLLTKGSFERLLDASSFTEQKRILSETPYGSYLESAQTPEDVEQALGSSQKDLYAEFLEKANLPEEVVWYFRTMHDFENVRGMLKAEALGIEADQMLTDLGSVPAKAFLAGEDELPAPMRKAVARIRERVQGAGDDIAIDMLDAAVDAEAAAMVVRIACASKSEFMCDLAKLGVDLGNLKSFVRARIMDMPVAEAERFFTEGGTIDLNVFLSGYRLPLEDIARLVADRPGLRGVDPEAVIDPARLDLVVDSAIADRFADARRIAVGPEPVLAYVASRKAEIATLRVLLIGKLVGVETDVLRARVRKVA